MTDDPPTEETSKTLPEELRREYGETPIAKVQPYEGETKGGTPIPKVPPPPPAKTLTRGETPIPTVPPTDDLGDPLSR